MSKNRILYAVLTDHHPLDGKYAILQRVVISAGKTLTDASVVLEKEYPTAKFETWVTTYIARSNSTDVRV